MTSARSRSAATRSRLLRESARSRSWSSRGAGSSVAGRVMGTLPTLGPALLAPSGLTSHAGGGPAAYRGRVSHSPLFLAALASSAVPGLDPVSVAGVRVEPGDLFEVAYVQDTQDRRWVVKAPLTAAAGAMLDDIDALSSLLGRRLDVAMPMVRGHAPLPEGRAAVYLRVPGRPLDFARLHRVP